MTSAQVILRCSQYERREHDALFADVTHSVEEYTPERVERLMNAVQERQRFTWPADLRVNV